jgi:DNA-binding response OmpR family regulator
MAIPADQQRTSLKIVDRCAYGHNYVRRVESIRYAVRTSAANHTMSQAGTRLFYEFSGFRLDPQQRLLTGRDDRRPIALVPKAFDTLLYLIERRGELVRKADLMKAVWPDLVVEDNSLVTAQLIDASIGYPR